MGKTKEQREKEKKDEEIKQKLIKVALELASNKQGALFVVVTGQMPKYELLVDQNVNPFSIINNKNNKLLKSLASIDGATIIENEGNLVVYGAMIKKTRAFKGFGTRHSAAIAASKNGNVAILVSEEEHKIKLFRNGKYIMQLDALERDVRKNIPRITTLFESLGAGLVGAVGVATLAPAIGITLIPGVVIFGGSYYTIKKIIETIRDRKLKVRG